MPTPAILSPELITFLTSRIDLNLEDRPVAEAFMNHTIPDENRDECHDYFDIKLSDNGPRISYTTRARLARVEGTDPFSPKGHRVLGRPASVAQRVAGEQYGGRPLDLFTSAAAAFVMPPFDIRIVRGKDIPRYYSPGENCECGGVSTGSLKTSCMRHEHLVREGRFAVYQDVAEMIVIFCPICDKIMARSILWTDTKGQKWHDRIYANPIHSEAIRNWGLQKGVRATNNRGVDEAIIVQVSKEWYDYLPSLDSLPYGCRKCGTLSNRACQKHFQGYNYQSYARGLRQGY